MCSKEFKPIKHGQNAKTCVEHRYDWLMMMNRINKKRQRERMRK